MKKLKDKISYWMDKDYERHVERTKREKSYRTDSGINKPRRGIL